MRQLAAFIGVALLLSACGSKPPMPAGVKVGKPYSIAGQTYYPEYDPHYDRTGTASWYGPGFHGRSTANGEEFNQDDLTAAHPTLPMPSIVRVTNLQNGVSKVIRVNDRGPFKDGRLIDLSRGSAAALGITGLAKVRVQYLKEETEQYWADMNLKTGDIEFAKNDRYAPKEGMTNYDGVVVARDEMSSQVKSAAPVTSVAAEELTAEDLKISPVSSHFTVVGAANESASPRAVQLLDKSGKPVKNTVKVVRAEDARQEASPAAGAQEGRWFVQAGAFASRENALRLAERLKPMAQVDIRDLNVGGRVLHRVRLGPFADRGAAGEALEKTLAEGAAGARVLED